MNKNIPNAPAPPKVELKDTTEVTCDKCSNNTFQPAMFMRQVSPIITGTGKPMYVPIDQAIVCTKCGHCNDQFVPEQLRKESLIVS